MYSLIEKERSICPVQLRKIHSPICDKLYIIKMHLYVFIYVVFTSNLLLVQIVLLWFVQAYVCIGFLISWSDKNLLIIPQN